MDKVVFGKICEELSGTRSLLALSYTQGVQASAIRNRALLASREMDYWA